MCTARKLKATFHDVNSLALNGQSRAKLGQMHSNWVKAEPRVFAPRRTVLRPALRGHRVGAEPFGRDSNRASARGAMRALKGRCADVRFESLLVGEWPVVQVVSACRGSSDSGTRMGDSDAPVGSRFLLDPVFLRFACRITRQM